MEFVGVFVLLFLAVALCMWLAGKAQEVHYVKSELDGRKYLVRRLPDSQKAADLLARLNIDTQKLIDHLVLKHPKDERAIRLKERYNPDVISEGSHESGYTSFNVGKGEKLVYCLRQTDNSFVDYNTLVYVSTHEQAHTACKTLGHDKEFWKTFKFILSEAVELGMYTKVDYKASPTKFCGISVKSSVL